MAETIVGTVAMFGGAFELRGWYLCDGRLLPIEGNLALYATLGGEPEGHSFRLPKKADLIAGLRYVINADGMFARRDEPRPPYIPDIVGMIAGWARRKPPENCVFAEGQLIAIRDNPELFSILGNRFGGSVESSKFGLPDLRDRLEDDEEQAIICVKGKYPTPR